MPKGYWFRTESQKHKGPKISSIQANIILKQKTGVWFLGAQNLNSPHSPSLECVHSYFYNLFLIDIGPIGIPVWGKLTGDKLGQYWEVGLEGMSI